MRSRVRVRRGVAATVALLSTLVVAATASATGTSNWTPAEPVPGLAALNTGTDAVVDSVACASAGNCTIGGVYNDNNGDQGFVATQTDGTWTDAIPVPGLAALNTAGDAGVHSVSCASPGNCTIGGYYRDTNITLRGFVATQTDGTWSDAIPVPGLAALNTTDVARVRSVACASPGNCTIGGIYRDGNVAYQGFVATQTDGTWTDAIPIPGLAALNTGGLVGVASLSCASAGNCTIGGVYNDNNGDQAFVATQTDGTWTDAIPVPGLAALDTGGDSRVMSVSCANAGNCTVAGRYRESNGAFQGFVATQTNGTWTDAIPVPGLIALNIGGYAVVGSVSCADSGFCTITGIYRDGSDQGFVATQTDGTWTDAIPIPGLAALDTGNIVSVMAVSCGDVGDCTVGGGYHDSNGNDQGFVATQTDGTWTDAIPVPGLEALNTGGNASTISVSCASAGNCTIGGYYLDNNGGQSFVASLSAPKEPTTTTTEPTDPVVPVFAG